MREGEREREGERGREGERELAARLAAARLSSHASRDRRTSRVRASPRVVSARGRAPRDVAPPHHDAPRARPTPGTPGVHARCGHRRRRRWVRDHTSREHRRGRGASGVVESSPERGDGAAARYVRSANAEERGGRGGGGGRFFPARSTSHERSGAPHTTCACAARASRVGFTAGDRRRVCVMASLSPDEERHIPRNDGGTSRQTRGVTRLSPRARPPARARPVWSGAGASPDEIIAFDARSRQHCCSYEVRPAPRPSEASRRVRGSSPLSPRRDDESHSESHGRARRGARTPTPPPRLRAVRKNRTARSTGTTSRRRRSGNGKALVSRHMTVTLSW